MRIEVKQFIHASHQLPDSDDLVTKKCTRLHGHTYLIKVDITSNELKSGMVVDFKAIKDIILMLDHRHVNDVFEEHDFLKTATAENIALFLFTNIQEHYAFPKLVVSVCEGYKGEELSTWVHYEGE